MTVHFVHYWLGTIPITFSLSQQLIFNRLSARTSEKPGSGKKKVTKVVHLAATSVNMISRGRDLFRWQRRGTFTSPASSPDSDYSPSLSLALMEQECAFQGTRSKVVTPYNYEQPFSLTRAVSPAPLRNLFQRSGDEEKARDTLHQPPSVRFEQDLYLLT